MFTMGVVHNSEVFTMRVFTMYKFSRIIQGLQVLGSLSQMHATYAQSPDKLLVLLHPFHLTIVQISIFSFC